MHDVLPPALKNLPRRVFLQKAANAAPAHAAFCCLALLLLTLLTAGRALGVETVRLGDQFFDNDRTLQTLPSSAQWFYAGASNATDRLWVTPPASSGQSMHMVANGSAEAMATAYFTAAGSPQSLAPGDSLSLDFTAKLDTLKDSIANFRVAIFNSAGLAATNRPVSDSEGGIFNATNTALYVNTHSGYILAMDTGATNPASFNLYRRYNQGNSTPFSFGTYLGTSNISTLNLKVKQPFPVHLKITRSTGAGTTITNEATVNGVTVIRTDATTPNMTNFDGFGLYISATSLDAEQALTVDDVVVNYVTGAGITNNLVSDSFADGERVTQSLPGSLKWFYTGQSVATNRLTCAAPPSAQNLVFTPGGNDAMALAYFATSGLPQTLAVGESITFQSNVHLDVLLNAADGIRFGLFNSGGVRPSADVESGIDSSTSYTNYTGYSAWLNPGASGGFNLYRRGGTGANPFSTSANTLLGASNTNNLAISTSLSLIPRFSITLTRLSSGMQIESAINGRSVVRIDPSPATTSFDTIAFFVSSNGLYEGPQALLDTINVIHASVVPAVPSIGKIFSQTFEGTAWTSPLFLGTNATGTISNGAFGTINILGSVTPSAGMRLDVNSIGSSNYWSGALNSGLIPITNTETNLGKLTLAFDLMSSAVRTIRVRLESADAGGVVGGALEKLIYPAGTNSFQRYTFELSDMTAASGTFSPTNPNVKLSFIMEGGIDAGSWAAGTNWLQVDNVYYARPAYYVKPTGSDSLNGQTEANAFLTISKALAVATNSGDIVLLMDGGISPAYAPATAMLSFQGGGTPGGWVTFKNYPGQSPLIQANEVNYDLFYISAGFTGASFDYTHSLNYIELRGLRMRGTADTLAVGLRGSSTPNSNVNGIGVNGRYMVKVPHHIRLANNEVYNFSGGGIAVIDTDWLFVENNSTHDTCFWTIYGPSGISSLTPSSFEGTAGTYRHYWLGNSSYHNQTNIKTASTGTYSDGNGAIIDTWLTTRHGPYLGRILVANNQFYENGGSGIHALYVNGADIINNTVVRNSASTNLNYPNIFAVSSDNIVVANNIIVASTNEPINNASYSTSYPQTTGVTFLNNIYLSDGSTYAPYVGPNDSGNITTTDVKFVDAANDDYRLTTNSPAFNAALASNILPVRDFYGVLRRTDGFADIGAFERQPAIATPPAAQTNIVGANVTFSVAAQSGGTNSALTYQWQLNGTNIAGATNNPLTLTNITVAKAGNYRAVVTVGSFDTVNSSNAALAVNKQTPVIATAPTTTAIIYGQTIASSTLGTGLVTNTAGVTVAGGFTFTTPGIVPKAGSTNVVVVFTPTDSTNYNTNIANVTVTVNPALLGVTANNTNKVYNNVPFSGGNGVTYSGFVNSDTAAVVGGALSYGGNSQGATNAGSYLIIPSGLIATNYTISYTNGTLTIAQASSSVSLVSSANPIGLGSSVYFTATVLPSTVTGNVVFSKVSGAFSTNAVSGGYASSLAITNLPSGTDVITAVYSGNNNYLSSTNTLNQEVTNFPAIAPSLSAIIFTNNQFQFTVTGTAGSNYVVQATTNLNPSFWIPLVTNLAPFQFTDTNSNLSNQRFYRGMVSP